MPSMNYLKFMNIWLRRRRMQLANVLKDILKILRFFFDRWASTLPQDHLICSSKRSFHLFIVNYFHTINNNIKLAYYDLWLTYRFSESTFAELTISQALIRRPLGSSTVTLHISQRSSNSIKLRTFSE